MEEVSQNNVIPLKPNVTKGQLLRKRISAFAVDVFIIGLIEKALWIGYFAFTSEAFKLLPYSIKASLSLQSYSIRLPIILTVYFTYFLASLYMGEGKTVGKHLFGLRVRSHEGDPYELSFMESFMRTVGYTTCYASAFFFFSISVFRKDGRGLPDFFSQTETLTNEQFAYEIYLLRKAEADAAKEAKKQENPDGEQLNLFAA
ncbi:MAG: RDD family protein [Oligoflexia bacterium]|nr:RDD family protein [Oligoflexia bacterium]